MKDFIYTNEDTLLPVPTALLEEVGITPEGVLQFYVADGKLIIEPLTDCDGNCDGCSFDEGDKL
jgi:hypothetical protein